MIVEKFIRFKRSKTSDSELFKFRYVPVFEYFVKRVVDKIGLPLQTCYAQLFTQDADNIIKDTVTLRLTILLTDDDDKSTGT